MADVPVYGFPISTFANIVRVVLTEKGVAFDFHDLEREMGGPSHLALHPFNRVPILTHGDFTLYETAAIVNYIDSVFEGTLLTPEDPRARARMVQWISAVNNYYYPYFSYHLAHERMIFPALGIAPDEKVVAAALPKVATALEVLERELADGRRFIIGDQLTLADFYMTPTLSGLVFTPEGAEMLRSKPGINAWQARIGALPSVQTVRAMVAPHIGKPVEHARSWVTSHRPRY